MTHQWSRSTSHIAEKDTGMPDRSSWNKKTLEVPAYRCLGCGWFVYQEDGERFALNHSQRYEHTVKFTPAGELP